MEADISSQAVGLASSADFSLINLFLRADIIVKSVIIILIGCSIYSWAVIIEKIKLFKKINESSDEFETKSTRQVRQGSRVTREAPPLSRRSAGPSSRSSWL